MINILTTSIKTRTRKNPTSYSNKQKQNIHGKQIKQCIKCNIYHEARKCKDFNTKCAKCNKTGHWAVCCRREITEVNSISREEEETLFLYSIKDDKEICQLDVKKT